MAATFPPWLGFTTFFTFAVGNRWAAFSQPGWDTWPVPSADDAMVVILALRQRNLDFLEDKARRVTDPVEKDYGKYYSRDELNNISAPSADDVAIVREFLGTKGGAVRFSKGLDLVKFVCTVSCVERTFGTRLLAQRRATKPGESPFRAATPIQLPPRVAEVLDGVSLNAPVFMPRRPKKEAAATFTFPGRGRKAPRLDPNLMAGDGSLSLRFATYCKDGSVNADRIQDGICSSSKDGKTIVSFEAVIIQEPNRQHVVQVPAVTHVLGERAGKCHDEVPCVEFNLTTAVQNYASTSAMVRAHFDDGSVSVFSSVSEVRKAWPLPYTTPHLLAKFYKFSLSKLIRHPRNTISVVEFLGQYYNPADLEVFFKLMGVKSWGQQALPMLIGKDRPRAGSVLGGEAQLDIQYIMAMASNVTTWFWSVPGVELSTKQEPFLEWLMQLSDSPDEELPLVHSVSYGDDEESVPDWFKRRVNIEFMKLALRGISVLVAAGDDGASGSFVRQGTQFCNKARPEFPAASPWVTSVGGTQLSKTTMPICGYTSDTIEVSCHYEAEVVCSSDIGGRITSGGGFSDHFKAPWYQRDAVSFYLQQSDSPVPPTDGEWHYNATGRAYPDITALANNYLVWMGGDLSPESGTSASTPLVSAMVAQWNEVRLQRGEPPLGFLNPLLYRLAAEHPEAFNDVLVGNNRCSTGPCCEKGFGAARGWDAVSGLGSPRVDVVSTLLPGGEGDHPRPVALGGLPGAGAADFGNAQGFWPMAACAVTSSSLTAAVLWATTSRARWVGGGSARLRAELLSY
eukprot:CAMPEP_0117491356 /NCGR_PEP_ID=MMETSP0784-20121206/18023_1 /TAXON_ID=39447 /ORGANISM="" /LENGTH=794 /DNA_ID=CAMNT_0005286141 /DNA_START=66 /DNA_END=2450 /DNA_ORIENTATION=+